MYGGAVGADGGGGRGQLFTVFMFLTFVFIFTFYKNILQRNKEIKKNREDIIRQQIEADVLRDSELRLHAELEQRREKEYQRQQEILSRMKENRMVCYDMHIFAFRPEKDIQKLITNGVRYHLPSKLGKKHRSYLSNEESEEQIKARRSMVSGPIAYLFVLVLLYSLVKATTEISQHFRKKATGEAEKRRCSLQEYASIKHERRNSKAQLARRSTFLTMDKHAKVFNKTLEERRISQVIPECVSISGQITEPGSPAKKITNGIATKPAPLLRRCSVPAFALGTTYTLRRTSTDSFSEDDSSPDVKRRVRMIHRH